MFLLILGLAWGSPAFGWWCEGHEVVALIAEKHLDPAAKAAVAGLLPHLPVDPEPFCKQSPPDPLAVASTWADDTKATEKTAGWHFMNIPVSLKKGDPEQFCQPIGPSFNGGERPGCILGALRYAVDVLHSDKEDADEKGRALDYLVHLMGDLTEPLHTTTDNDQGGNCFPVTFFDNAEPTNLHAVWDGLLLERELATKNETVEQFAAAIDSQFAGEEAEWTRDAPHFDKWAWESHMLAREVVYGDLQPKPPFERPDPKANCKAESQTFGALHEKIDADYAAKAMPIIEEQLAKGGYRLAAVLNAIWP